MVSTVNYTTINCNQSVCTITSVYLNSCKIIDVWHNSKFTIRAFDTWVDGEFGVITRFLYMGRKRDLIIS